MAILHAIISTIILGVFYYRMVKRETPTPISSLQALLPIGAGIASMSVSFYVFIGVSVLIGSLGISASNASDFVRSMLFAFMTAGAPEELTKLVFMLVIIFLFRKKIRNVYEYILIGAGVGFGFTIVEEIEYAAEGDVAWVRLLTLAGHMVYGILMARHLGLAKYNKVNRKSRFLQYVLAFVVPALLHTLYDACTGQNLMLISDDPSVQDAGILLGMVGTGVHFVLQFVILFILRKNAPKYCSMSVTEQAIEQTVERSTEPATEQTVEQSTEQATEQSTEPATEPATEQTVEQTTEN